MIEDETEKQILFLFGSKSDIKEDTKKTIEDCVVKAKTVFGHGIKVVSADRAPDMLAPTINDLKWDAIIYSGAYSLQLGGAIAKALDGLRRNSEIVDGRMELEEFYRHGDLTQRPPQIMTPRRKSKYAGDETFVPFIAVPMPDSISSGIYALTSVIGQPPTMEPRPAVGLGNFRAAMNAADNIMKNKYNGINIFSPRSNKEGEIIKGYLTKEIRMDDKLITVGAPQIVSPENNPLNILLFEAGDGVVERFDKESNFYIGVSKKETSRLRRFMADIGICSNGIFLGPGSYENAAILAARILSLSLPEAQKKELEGKINIYINKKTGSSMFGIER